MKKSNKKIRKQTKNCHPVFVNDHIKKSTILVLQIQTIAKNSNNVLKTVARGPEILYLFNNFWQRIVLRVFSAGSRAWKKKETERESEATGRKR
jgi:hypothetical protein